MHRTRWIMVSAVVAIASCGDPETSDDRGYTKAPLEKPTVLIKGEESTSMREFGAPNLPSTEPLEFPDSAAGG